jgi:hypothetical protein
MTTAMKTLVAQHIQPAPDSLDNLVTEINKAHGEVERAFTSAIDNALVAGKLLLEAKSLVKHGNFNIWIKTNCEFSDRMARAYMRVANKFPTLPDKERQRVADMSLRGVLKLFASPGGKPRMNQVIRLADVETADLVAELEARPPAEAEKPLFVLVSKWADDAGNEIIVRPKKAAASETTQPTSDKEIEEDPLAIPPFLDRRDATSDTNHDEEISPNSHNQENNDG